MYIESKIKLATLKLAADITLKGLTKNPKRCARNIIELMNNSYPNLFTKSEQTDIQNTILALSKEGDTKPVRDYLHHLLDDRTAHQ